MDYTKTQPIIELYKCIQTEGSKAGIPHILIRTTGCTHRCWFGDGGWCDSWYTSIHPERGRYTLQDVQNFLVGNMRIDHLMITGGSPTMHPDLVNEIINLFHEVHEGDSKFITIETEGSHFIKTDIPIDLISLSPKFKNSIPSLGIKTPQGKIVDDSFIEQHNKFRLNHEAIRQMIDYHKDFHFKPVVSELEADIWNDIEEFRKRHGFSKHKVWVMPAGSTREEVIPNYAYVIEQCVERGYNFSGRAHIIAFNDQRGV